MKQHVDVPSRRYDGSGIPDVADRCINFGPAILIISRTPGNELHDHAVIEMSMQVVRSHHQQTSSGEPQIDRDIGHLVTSGVGAEGSECSSWPSASQLREMAVKNSQRQRLAHDRLRTQPGRVTPHFLALCMGLGTEAGSYNTRYPSEAI